MLYRKKQANKQKKTKPWRQLKLWQITLEKEPTFLPTSGKLQNKVHIQNYEKSQENSLWNIPALPAPFGSHNTKYCSFTHKSSSPEL